MELRAILNEQDATIAALRTLARELWEALRLEGTCLCTDEKCYTCRALARYEAAKREGLC